MEIKLSKELMKRIATANADPDVVGQVDFEMIAELLPIIRKMGDLYFRSAVRGVENIPDGPALIVGNHNAGITFMEPFLMAAEYYTWKGLKDPLYFIAHDAMVSIPVLKNLLIMGGSVRGNYENSHKVLSGGNKLVVFPGGNHEAFRTYKDRYKIDFGGHKGFAKVALQENVPIVPHVNVGGHETFFVLTPGTKLAKIFKVDKIFRSKTCAISFALPWGISFGPIFHLPLPAKLEIEIGKPIYPAEITKGIKGEEAKVDKIYEVVTAKMQEMMTEVSSRRKYPVIG